jgi:chemotaxis family two-component system sensor kinase Cph1
LTATHTTVSLQTAIEHCAREPIRIPGSIQPHGFLLALEEPSLTVLQVSQNAGQWLQVDCQALLGQTLTALIDDAEAHVAQLGSLDEDESQPFHVGDVCFRIGGLGNQRVAMMLHRHGGRLIAEFEPSTNLAAAHSRLYPLVRSFISQHHDSEGIDDLCLRAVEAIKRLSGFGRVMAYRFDHDDNGLVIAELLDPGYDSYLGLCFPASDIPAQARALYVANRIRVIEDVDYQPSPLLPTHDPHGGQPLDLSFATLRSVSPVHLQYMRNMGTAASMSVSIIVDGALWGMISCHHATPHTVSFQTRTACELLSRVVSLQIDTRQAHLQNQRMLNLRRHTVQLLSAMADNDSVNLGLRALPDVFIGLVGASGAAVVSGSACDLYGNTPTRPQVQALAAWLAARGGGELFHSDNVGRDIPAQPELTATVGGVLAVSISEIHSNYLIWFKPEQAQLINWAGRLEKKIDADGSLSPRHSFEHWQQTVEGFSTPWDATETDGVLELRAAVLGIVLRKAEELAQLADQLQKSNKELEAFSYSVSHDLRAPLRHIAGYAELLTDIEAGNLSQRGQRFLDTIGESAKFAGTLVDNLLSFSQMGRSAMRLSEVNLLAMIESICREMRPDYEGREIRWNIKPLPIVIADPAFLHLALRNLLANAIKYTRNEAVAEIEVDVLEREHDVVISVRDNGVGFDMQYAGKLFGVFQRLHRMEEFEGTGIGLANVRRIVERHDGSVWAEGTLNKGATFYFSLPKRTLTPVA